MGHVTSKLKRAGQQFWYGDKYLHFEQAEQQPRVPFTSSNAPIQELGVMVGGTGIAITASGAAIELTNILSHELAQMTVLSGLGGLAIGGAIYAYGRISE